MPYYQRIVDFETRVIRRDVPILISAFGCPKTTSPAAFHWTQRALDDLINDPDLQQIKGFSWWNATLTYQGMANWKSEKGNWTYQGKGSFKKLPNMTWQYLGDNFDMQIENNPLAASIFQRYLSARKLNHWPRIKSTSPGTPVAHGGAGTD